MKVLVIGIGQCGGRIADEFARLNTRARNERDIEILTGAYAVNSDMADLSGLTTIKSDQEHRIIIGARRTGGHGVGKINERGAAIAVDDADKVVDAIRNAKHFYQTDAFLLIAGAGGGTGSGAISVITKEIKERYRDKAVYDLVVLPFDHEDTTEERSLYNAATCLKSCYLVADAVILIDNQRYVSKDSTIMDNVSSINSRIVAPFYDLLCAGEEKKSKYIGAKLLDAGDIIETLAGWTVIGSGSSEVPLFKLRHTRRDFKEKGAEVQKAMNAMDEALSELSLACDSKDSGRALYLMSGPAKELSMDMVKELGGYLRSLAPRAVIRNGDYPRGRGSVDITVVLSEIKKVAKVSSFLMRSNILAGEFKKRQEESKAVLKDINNSVENAPSEASQPK